MWAVFQGVHFFGRLGFSPAGDCRSAVRRRRLGAAFQRARDLYDVAGNQGNGLLFLGASSWGLGGWFFECFFSGVCMMFLGVCFDLRGG